MKTKILKLTGIFLTLALLAAVIGVFAITASAAETAGGITGDVSWTLTDDGTLTFSGEGAMADYSNGSQPWYAYKDSIKTVIITKGVTSVSTYAFYEFPALATVKIAGSVTAIGNNAFAICENLSTVEYYGSSNPVASSNVFSGSYSLFVAKVLSSYNGNVFCGIMAQATLDAANEPLPPCDHAGHTQTGCTACGASDGSVHSFENGFCTVCDAYEEPTLNAEGYYEIDNAGKLYWFAEKVNGGETAFSGILTADITVNEGTMTASTADARPWTPIGTQTNKYAGTFDGAGHTVSGLYFSDSTINFVGLFGWADGGKIRNVGIINSCFDSKHEGGESYVGGVVGFIRPGEISNCYNTGTVSGNHMVGGVAGFAGGTTIANCYNTGAVSGRMAGGVVGRTFAESGASIVTNCYNTGTVSGISRAGGVVGYNSATRYAYKATVSNCYNTGTVSSASGDIGGVVGDISTDGSIITNCYYLTGAATGGINGADAAGSAEAKIASQFSSGEVAYLLGSAWGQTIGENGDAYPVLATDTNKVYQHTNCDGVSVIYCNTATVTEHQEGVIAAECFDENGVCLTCGAQAAASFTTADATPVVTYYMTLEAAITAAYGQLGSTVTLFDDITLDKEISVISYFILDLNGKTLSSSRNAIWAVGADVDVISSQSGGTIESGEICVYVGPSSNVTVTGVTLNSMTVAGSCAAANGANAVLTLKDVTVYSKHAAISSSNGAEIEILGNSSISGDTVDLSCTDDATLTVGAGATFSNGLKASVASYEHSLGEMLADGMAYWTGENQMVQVGDDTYEISGTVTVKAACAHSDMTKFTYTAEGAILTATCHECFCVAGALEMLPEFDTFIYDGTEKRAFVYDTIPGVQNFEFVYTGDWTNVGTHSVSVTMGGATATLTVEIEKATPTLDDFDFTLPDDYTYNGEGKALTATLKNGLSGAGEITIQYYDASNNLVNGLPANAGAYDIYLSVAEGENYTAVSNLWVGAFSIQPFMLGESNLVQIDTEFTYSGDKQMPKIALVANEKTLVLDEDYTLAWDKDGFVNAGTYTATIKGIGNYQGMATASFEIKPKALLDSGVSIDMTEEIYSGGAYYPIVVVRDGITQLSTGSHGDYDVTWDKEGFVDAGVYTATVTGKNNYSGSFTRTFVIKQAEFELEFASPIMTVLPGNQIAMTLNTNSDATPVWSITGGTHISDKKVKIADDLTIGEDQVTITVTFAETNNVKGGSETITLKVGMPDFSGEIKALEADIAELEALVAGKADAAEVNQKLGELLNKIEALENVKDAYKDADATLKEALEKAIGTAKQEAIDTANSALDAAKAELNAAIANKADKTALEQAIATLNEAIKTAETVAKAYADAQDAALKTELNAAIDAAKNEAIASAEALVNDAKAELQKAIDTKADSATLNEKVSELNEAIKTAETVAKAYADAQDAALKTELNAAINAAKSELEALIGNVQSDLDATKAKLDKAIEDLNRAIADGDKALSDEIAALTTALNEAKAALEKADAANKTELVTKIETADTALDAAIKQVQKNLDDAKAALEKAIADGDTKLDTKITALNEALDAAKKALEASDAANKNELSAKMEEADATLKAAIDVLSKALDSLKTELDGVKTELATKGGNDSTFNIIFGIVSGITFCGCGALAVLYFLDKKKKI